MILSKSPTNEHQRRSQGKNAEMSVVAKCDKTNPMKYECTILSTTLSVYVQGLNIEKTRPMNGDELYHKYVQITLEAIKNDIKSRFALHKRNAASNCPPFFAVKQ